MYQSDGQCEPGEKSPGLWGKDTQEWKSYEIIRAYDGSSKMVPNYGWKGLSALNGCNTIHKL
jgi:hypothetical protein